MNPNKTSIVIARSCCKISASWEIVKDSLINNKNENEEKIDKELFKLEFIIIN